MKEYKDKLRRITEVLLEPEDCYGKIKKATDDLYELLINITQLNEDEDKNKEAIYLESGKAIGTIWAAMCINEFLRTKKFIRGVYLGIKEAQKRFPNRTINILYAGTGPFATLAVPLTTVFTSEEIRFTFIEINKESILSLQKVIEAFALEDYVREITQGDAAQYDAYSCKPFHMIITETMLNALRKEPQVAITMNLLPHMEKDGILIPENIIIDAVLVDEKKNRDRILSLDGYNDKCYHNLGTIFELNKNIISNLEKTDTKTYKSIIFPETDIELTEDIERNYNHLCLFTEIKIFENELLTHWQSSLNLPYNIMDIDWKARHPKAIGFRYIISEHPKFEFSIKNYSE